VRAWSNYLQLRPYDSVWTWGSHPRYAALMSQASAEMMAAALRDATIGEASQQTDARALEDYDGRKPELGDPELRLMEEIRLKRLCGHRHWWYWIRPRVLRCKRCGELKRSER